jgi:hypothetical protein
MKRLILFLIVGLSLSNCATYKGCQELKQWVVKDANCINGYKMLYQAGAPYCMGGDEVREIESICGIWW